MNTRLNARYVIIPVVLIALLAAFSVPASADDSCKTIATGTIHGGVYYDMDGDFHGAYGGPFTFQNVPPNVKIARLHAGVWMGDGGTLSMTLNGYDYPTIELDNPPPDVSVFVTGCGVYFICYNATSHVVPGNNIATASTSGCSDGRMYGIGLLGIYEDESMPEMKYWINEGSAEINSGCGDPWADEISVYFHGSVNISNAQELTYWTMAFPNSITNNPKFNENDIGYCSYSKGGDRYIIERWDNIPVSYLDPSSNLFYYYDPDACYERVNSAVFTVQYGEPAPDTTPPYTVGHNPAKGATDVPPDTNIVVHIMDDGTGVDQSTIVMTVNEANVTESLIIDGSPLDYTVVYDPPADFNYGQVVDVTFDAADLNETPNVMPTDSYSFTIKELEPSTSFFISGWVNDSAGEPVNNPVVNITNTNTSEVFTAETIATSNYYQVLTSSDNVSAGNVLHFYARDNGNVAEFNHTVTEAEMNKGGFEQNVTILFPYIDLIVANVDAYHNATDYPPYVNLSNEIDVTVENAGTKAANPSHVSLYIDGELYGKQSVPALDAGCNATVQFTWTPTGIDCEDGGIPVTYTLKAIADCDGEIDELNEGNNGSTAEETAYWAGWSAEEVLSTAFHGTIHGSLNFATGDGVYTGLYSPGASTDIHYDITVPDGASVELARLNVYYTWSKTDSTGVYASMGVSITNPSGGAYTLSTDKKYNDRPCDSPAINFDYPYGNYVYDLTPYINGSGAYTVTVKNNGTTGHSFAIDPPGLVILYNDTTKPEYEYWILEGADILEGGRRPAAGYLALEECINNATFEGTIDLNKMVSATLGLATPWGGDGAYPSYLYFNGNELGKDVYHGYDSQYSKTLNGMSMHIGSTNAQMGVNLTDVTSCLVASNNVVGQGDDGDSMLVANAFLLVERVGEKKDDVAIAEETVKGNVIEGSYKNTTASDNDYEAIEEMVRGKKSLLEHKWTINVTSGSKANVTFHLEAHQGIDTGENDDFVFAYSTDGSTYTDMVEVNTTEDTNLTYKLPNDLSGTVYIRVKDTDRTNRNTKLDAIYIDHMFIRSVFGAPSYGVSVTIEPASQTVKPTDSTTYTVTVTNTGDLNASYTVNMSGTAVVNETITVNPLNWNTGILEPNEVNVTTVTVSTSNTPEETYTLTATATCVEDASVTDSDTSNLVVSSVTTMHVASIDMRYKKTGGGPKGADYRIYTKVKIVDASNDAVVGARVELNTTLPPGETNVSDYGDTGDDGTVEFMYGPTKTTGTYTSTVTNVTKYEWTYDPAANVVTSETLIVP